MTLGIQSIKKAPRWAWYTVGGVTIGATALHFYKNRTTSTSTDAANTSDVTSGTTMGDPFYADGGSSPAGVVVPPIITDTSQTDQSGTGLGDLQNLFMGGVAQLLTTLPATYQDVWGPVQDANLSVLNTAVGSLSDIATSAIANAGSPPQPVITLPTPVGSPTPAAPTPRPSPASPPPPSCPSGYPFGSPTDSHGCYKVVCATGKGSHAKGRWHYHSDGYEAHVGDKC